MTASASAPPTIRWSVNPVPTVHMAFNLAGTTGTAQAERIPVLAPAGLGVLALVLAAAGWVVIRRRW